MSNAVNMKNIVLNDSKIPKNASFKHVFVNLHDENKDSTKNVSFQLKNVKAPFGVSYLENGNDVKSTVALSLDNHQEELLSFVKEFEKFVLNQAVKKSDTWFGKELTHKEVKGMFKQSLYHKNPNFPPSLTAKVPPTCIVSDEKKNIIKLSSIRNGQFVNAKIEIGGVWITTTKFGISWKFNHIECSSYKPTKTYTKTNNYAFDDDDE